MSALLEVQGLNAWYGAAHVVTDVNLQVRRGEVVGLMGRNGAGKSSTLKAIMGLMSRRSGQIQFCGHDVSRVPTHELSRRGLGYVPEDRRVFSELSVLENLEVGRQPLRQWPDGTVAPQWTPEKLFQVFPNLADMQDRLGSHMSGGEQQMLSVARTLMGNPLLVLLDEPSEGLAPQIVLQMARMIEALKSQGVSVLLSEQNEQFAARVCDRNYTIVQGCVSPA
jgi:branched-chain amino acid transport system ATP-binding protein